MPSIEKKHALSRRECLVAMAAPALLRAAPDVASESLRHAGTKGPEAELVELTAGPLTLAFQPDIAFVRYVRLGDREVLRGIYSAVRNGTWGTVAPSVSNLQVRRNADSFELTFQVDCNAAEIRFAWEGRLTGKSDGTVRYTMDGTAHSDFLRNRIGFCVLHPMRECAGQPCTIEQVDGTAVDGRFPDLISPHQPFRNIRAITHQAAPGVRAEVRMEGDTFEMEDHRNWTDSNFKTYCTPLELPYPVRVARGSRISQTVTLTLKGKAQAPAVLRSKAAPVRLRIVDSSRPLPAIGYGLDSRAGELTRSQAERVRAIRPAHLRVDLELGKDTWKAALSRATAVSRAVDAPLECAVTLSGDAGAQLDALGSEAARLKSQIARWLVFRDGEASTSAQWIQLARKHLPGGPRLGAGTDQFFTELNRGRPAAELLDVVCYSVNPQVHAFDNRSLAENLESQADTVRTARSFGGKSLVAVTPVTFRPRHPAQADSRQGSLFGAGWTMGSMKYLAEAGADSVTYYELTGERGLMEDAVFPLYHVFADVAGMQHVTPVRSSDPLRVEALLLGAPGAERLVLANLTGKAQRVELPRALGGPVRRLDASAWTAATSQPERWRREPARRATNPAMTMDPWSVVTIG